MDHKHPPDPPSTHPQLCPYRYRINQPARSSSFSSCILAFSFFLLILVAVPIVLFFLFRPHNPSIQVNAVKFTNLSVFSLSAVVRNPNRASFSHYDSTIRLLHDGDRQIGFMYIPAGEIGGGRTMNMEATFNVDAPIHASSAGGSRSSSSVMEVELRVEMKGKVRVLRVLMHRVKVVAVCRVVVAAADGKVMGARCTST